MNNERYLVSLGQRLRQARRLRFPQDDLKAFSVRIGVSRATLQKMEQGDTHVAFGSYLSAADILDMTDAFNQLFEIEKSLFDD